MKKIVVIVCLVILAIGAGTEYVWLPAQVKQLTSVTDKNYPKAVQAIKSYAALQFSVPESQVAIRTSQKQNWDSICLGLPIKDYDCKKVKTSGYEATVQAGGYTTTYRSSDDGKIVRVVKD
jgi:hypothetical protein